MRPNHKGLCKPCSGGELDPQGIGKPLKLLQEVGKWSDLHLNRKITAAIGCI